MSNLLKKLSGLKLTDDKGMLHGLPVGGEREFEALLFSGDSPTMPIL